MHSLLSWFCSWDIEDIRACATEPKDRHRLEPAIDGLVSYVQKSLENHNIRLKRAHNRLIHDGITKKVRAITIATILQQIYDYIAKIGLQELFDAKFTPHQCATIKGRGQVFGKKLNEHWMREQKTVRRGGKAISSKPASTYAVEADARKCYPSMSVGKLKSNLRRDVRNKELLWLAFYLIDKMSREQWNLRGDMLRGKRLRFASGKCIRGARVKRGISIGSYLSCNLCNYQMSYAWRHLMQDAVRWEMRKGKDGVYRRARVRLVSHCIIYMDNFTIYGSNKRDLAQAERILEEYMRKKLGMRIKGCWLLYRLEYKDKKGNAHGSPVDGMGYVVFRDHTRMRGKIFLRARRKYVRLRKRCSKNKKPSKRLCGSVVSYNGWFDHVNARKWQRKYDYKYHVMRKARKQFSAYMKEDALNDKYRALVRSAAAG